MKDKMRIGELAELAGVTPRTIRYYEGLGLLGPNEREGHGFRYYTDTELFRLKKIDSLKQMGLSLDEVGEVLPLYCDGANMLSGKRRVLEILQAHLADVDEKIDTLQQLRADLEANIAIIERYLTHKNGA